MPAHVIVAAQSAVTISFLKSFLSIQFLPKLIIIFTVFRKFRYLFFFFAMQTAAAIPASENKPIPPRAPLHPLPPLVGSPPALPPEDVLSPADIDSAGALSLPEEESSSSSAFFT